LVNQATLLKPDEEELGGQRGDGEIEALDAQARDAEDEADQRRDHAGQHEDNDDVEPRERGGQLERRVATDGHEPARAQRQLPRIACEQIQPDRRHRVDQERNQHRLQPVLVRDQWDGHERGHDRQRHQPLVLDDRKDRLITRIRRFKLPSLPIDHRAFPGR
jgi:hypothetical protein